MPRTPLNRIVRYLKNNANHKEPSYRLMSEAADYIETLKAQNDAFEIEMRSLQHKNQKLQEMAVQLNDLLDEGLIVC